MEINRYMKGLLISFEGIDFSGKSLQANLLREKLVKKGYDVLFLREPGGTEISEQIREVLLNTVNQKMSAITEVLLYSAARAQMVEERVIPHLQKNGVVICDRYYDSTTAYQGYGRGLDLDFIEKLNTFATKGVRPHVTYLLDLKPELAQLRKDPGREPLDRMEQEDADFHKRVRQGYLKVAQSEKDRFVVIDGTQAVEKIHEQILEVLRSKFQINI